MLRIRIPQVIVTMAAITLLCSGVVWASETKTPDTGEMLKYFSEWNQSKHPSTRLVYEGNVKLPGDEMCLVCHDSAGFLQWSKTGFKPDWGDDARLGELGPAPTANCEVCHDQAAKDPAKLRISGATPDLRGGFKVADAGSGAVCIICHNSRRGLRNDKSKPVATKHGPHEASNADVLYGENFYFVPNGEIKHHADVDDSCVACHMSAEYKGGGHTFKAGWDNCNDCHDDVDGQAEKKKVMAAREELKSALDSAVTKAVMAASNSTGFEFKHVTEDEVVDKDYTKVLNKKVTGVNSIYFHAFQNFRFKMEGKDYMTCIVHVKLQGQDLLKTEQGQVLAKAGWNLYMIDHDRSNGAHNAPYVLAAVKATVAQLQKLDFSEMKALPK